MIKARIAMIAVVVGAVLGLGSPPAFGSGGLEWTAPTLIDSHQPYAAGGGVGLEGVSCPSAGLCVALDQNGYAVASSDPTSGSPTYASTPVAPAGVAPRDPVDCPTASFCMAIAGQDVYSSHAPGAGVWSAGQQVDSTGSLSALSCDPTTTLCVAVDGAGNEFTTTDPTSSSPTWTTKSIDSRAIDGVSCPSTSLCVAVDDSGYVITSSSPGAQKPTWTSQLVNHAGTILDVSCAPETTTCVATADSDPNVFTTTTPAAGWNSATIDAGKVAETVSCGSATLCVVSGNGYGTALLTNDPGSTAPTWSSELRLSTAGSTVAVGCAPSFCVGVDDDGLLYSDGDVITSNQNPTSASSTWTALRQDGYDALTSVSCPTTALCAAGDDAGDLLTTDDPATAQPSWTVDRADPGSVINAVSCDPTASLCVAIDNANQAATSTDPTAAKPTWSAPTLITLTGLLESVSCPSASLCVAVDGDGDVLINTDPAAAAASWSVHHLLSNTTQEFVSVSCPSTAFCMAGWHSANGAWGESSSTNPADPASWITSTGPGTAQLMASVSCASSTLCVALTSGVIGAAGVVGAAAAGGNVAFATADPASSRPTWAATAAPVGPIDCPTTRYCVAADGPRAGIGPTATADGAALLAGSANAWTDEWSSSTTAAGGHIAPDLHAPIAGVSCPTASFCVTVDGQGYAMTGVVLSTLSVTISGTGSGEVTGPRLSCTSSCTQFYLAGTPITLTASPAPGSMFAGWSGGACSGTGPCTLSTDSDTSIGASFKLLPPVCRLSVRDNAVHLERRHGSRKIKGATVRVRGACNQPGKLTLSGLITERPHRHGQRTRRFRLTTRHLTLTRAGGFSVSLQLPRAAVQRLSRRALASLVVTLKETNANGDARVATSVRHRSRMQRRR